MKLVRNGTLIFHQIIRGAFIGSFGIAFLSGCNMSATLQELLSNGDSSIKLEIADKTPELVVNDVNKTSKAISGQCVSAAGDVSIFIDSVFLATANCNASQWSKDLDLSALPEGSSHSLTVTQNPTTGVSLTDTANLLKDTVAPQIAGLSDVLIPQASMPLNWTCVDAADQCKFRFQVSTSPVYIFVAEPYVTTSNTTLLNAGHNYVYVQAIDKAQNVSAPVRVEVYVGEPKIFIGGNLKTSTTTGIEDLNILASSSLAEMALFNNGTCTGTVNWIPRSNIVSAWNLDPAALGGTASVSVKFKTADGQVSGCYNDTIQWPNPTVHTMCTTTTSSLSTGRVVDSGGLAGAYTNNEACTLNLTLPGPTTFIFDSVQTENGYDFLRILDGATEVLNFSGSGTLANITTTSANVQIEFTSDSSVIEPGFNIRWEPATPGLSSLSLNNGDAVAFSSAVTAILNYDSIFKEVYLTEDNSCSAGGSWAPVAAQYPWSFSDTTNGGKVLFVKFRDVFGNESFCESDGITVNAPQISIDNPIDGDVIGSTLNLAGTCSAPGKTVEILGTVSGTVTCANDESWTKTFDLSAIANGSVVSITANLKDGTTTVASATGSYTTQRQLTIDAPAANAYVATNYTVNGSCNMEGAAVEVTAPSAVSTTCSGGAWSVNLTTAGNDGDIINFTVQMKNGATVEDSKTRSFVLSTAAPTATISGAPVGTSIAATVSVGIGGTNVSKYKYKFASAADCTDGTGYSAEYTVATVLNLNQSALANGNVTLCVVGKSSINGSWQAYADATSATWYKDSNVLVNISSIHRAVTEGASGLQLTVTLEGIKTTDTRVYFSYYGNNIYMADHNLAPGYINIPAGNLSASATFDTFDNGLADGDRELRIYLTHTNNAAVNIGYQYLQSVLIKDDDQVYKTVTKVSSSRYGYCAIYSDKKMRCWGDNYTGQLGIGNTNRTYTVVEPSPADLFNDVSISDYTVCAITSLKKLKCWGKNYYGQLGTGDTVDRYTPTDIDASENYISVSQGYNSTCALTEAGKVKCWGYNSTGVLGQGDTTNRSLPVVVDGTETYSSIKTTGGLACGITTAGVLKCWGYNGYENIVVGSTTNQTLPVVVDAGTSYSYIYPGATTCGITTTGSLKCWGYNGQSQVGNGGTTTVTSRSVVDAGTTYKKVNAAGNYTCGITSNDDLKCWGEVRGVFSYQQTNQKTLPTLVPDGNKYSDLALTTYGGCAISLAGDLICMGDNYNQWFYPLNDFELVDVDPLSTVTSYTAGASTICAINSSGTLYCFGSYAGTDQPRTTPVVVDQGASYLGGSVSASGSGACIMNASGAMKCTGYNAFGAVGDGTATTRNSFVNVNPAISFVTAVREQFYCGAGIDTNGKMYVWGDSGGGTCGAPTTSRSPAMTDAATTYRPYLDVGNGDTHFCAITTADDLKCWGYDSGPGHLGGTSKTVPTLMDSGTKYKTVSIAGSTTCGITSADKLKCWGNGANGRLGRGSTSNSSVPTVVDSANNYSRISVGGNTVCGITTGGDLKCWGYVGDYTSNTYFTTPQLVNAGTTYQEVVANGSAVAAITTSGVLHYWPLGRIDQSLKVLAPTKTFKSIKSYKSTSSLCALSTDDHLYCNKTNWDATQIGTPRFLPTSRWPN